MGAYDEQVRHRERKLAEALREAENELAVWRQRGRREERLLAAWKSARRRARLSHFHERAKASEARVAELTAVLRPTEEALTRVLRLAEVLPAETGALIRAAIDGKSIEVRTVADDSFLTDEVKLSVRCPGGRPVETLVCNECGKVRHLGSTCEEAEAGRHPLVEWFAREVDRALREACDHRDPNRLGHRPSDLALVCACGETVFPPPRPFGPSGPSSYAERVNAPLRPETVAALGEAMQAGTAPRRLMVRKHQGPRVEGCAVCRQPIQFCDCPEQAP